MLRGFMSTTLTFWPTNLQKVLPHLHIEVESHHVKQMQQRFRDSKHIIGQVTVLWFLWRKRRITNTSSACAGMEHCMPGQSIRLATHLAPLTPAPVLTRYSDARAVMYVCMSKYYLASASNIFQTPRSRGRVGTRHQVSSSKSLSSRKVSNMKAAQKRDSYPSPLTANGSVAVPLNVSFGRHRALSYAQRNTLTN